MKFPALPNLDGLIGLSRKGGVDVRPTLLRVLTDLYIQKVVHTRDEEQHYTELCLWLLSEVDVPTRVAVAKKIASYPAAPPTVVRRLAHDVFEVAEPILLDSPCLSSDDLVCIANECSPHHAAAIAARDNRHSAHAAGLQPGLAEIERAAGIATAKETGGYPRIIDELNLGEYFLQANSVERCFLLTRLENAISPAPAELRSVPSDTVSLLEKMAFQRNRDEFSRALEQSLQISREKAQRIAHDETGEAIVVAAKAIRMSPDILLRVLLFLNPRIGESVERVFSLVKLYNEVTPTAALRIAAGWQDSDLGDRRAHYQPVHWNDDIHATRRLRSDHARGTGQTSSARPRPTRLASTPNQSQGST